MDKKNKNPNVPNLRFPNFCTPWKIIPISNLLQFQNGINGSPEQYGKGVKFISVGDILNNIYITYDNIKGLIDIDEKTLYSYSVTYGDILFQRSSEIIDDIGRTNVYLDKNNIATFGGFVIRGKKIGQYNPVFFNYLLKSPSSRKSIIRLGAGAQHYNIGQENIKTLNFCFPDEIEQAKIACLFSKIDERIQTQSKIIDDYISLLNSLRDHLIYTHNSKKATLSGYIDIYNGYTFKSKNYIKDGKYKVITISNVTGQRFVNLASINTINKIPFDIQNYQIIAKDSILVSLTGNVGRTSICNVDNCLLNQRVALVKCKNIDSKYIYHILSSTRFLRKMCLSSQGAAQKNISTKDILDYMIPLHSNQEIKNITRLLEAVESKLDIEKNILNFLYQQKTYLLKNMFI